MARAEPLIGLPEDDARLVEAASTFVGRAIVAGDGALLIAAQARRGAVQRRLKRVGLDLAFARERGQYVALDAARLLAKIYADGRLDLETFERQIDSAVEPLVKRWPRVSAFNEMPMLLAASDRDASLEVEAAWGSLARRLSFEIFRWPQPAEERGVDSERAMLASIIESSQDAVVTKNFDGIIQSWNAGAQRLFGYSAREAVGKSIILIIPPERLAEENDILARVRRGERIEHYETVRVTKDGRRVEISLTISPLREPSGKLVGASKIARDITQRKRAEAALRESEQRFASFMHSLPGLAWVKDLEGRYVFASEAVQKPFGMSLDEIYGKTDNEIFPPETARTFLANDAQARSKPGGVKVIEALEHEDGTHYSIVSKFPIFDAEGALRYVGGIAIDITDRMRAEEALREADRRKDEFLATLAHELRNPLAPIRNSLHILQMSGQSSPVAERVHSMMERQVAHLVRLVDDLLELSRISLGRIELRRVRLDLKSIIDHALEASEPFIEAGGHILDVQIPAAPIFIEGDPVRLSQSFANLLNNAAKYTNKGGRIMVGVRVEGTNAVVSFRDTGIGISAEMLPRVFEMFAQADHGLRRDGLGIGLSLVRTLVEMHGGAIEARSDGAGKGSEFIVRLPILEAAAAEGPAADAGAQGRAAIGHAHRILVVDDNRDSADSLDTVLRFLGADVHVAYDGRSALDALRSFEPSVILMDLGMPGMDGCEVARRIRAGSHSRDALMIAMTGWGQDEDRRRSREAGFDHHLVKPIDLDVLKVLLSS